MVSDSFEQLRDDIIRGDTIAVRRFLERGGDPNVHSEKGECALSAAAIAGQTPVVEILIHAGALVDGHSKSGWTPLYFACAHNHVRTVQTLLNNGASRNVMIHGKPMTYWLSLNNDRQRVIELLTHSEPGQSNA